MLASIEGKIELKTERFILVNVNGVGYRVFCPVQILAKMPEKGEKVKLFIHLYVRENILELYGFLSFEELEFFELLISISGLGPKAGLGILSVASLKDLRAAISSGQIGLLTKVSGVGKKTAERVILELRNKILVSGKDVKELVADDEVFDALRSLGYSAGQIREALRQVPEKIKGPEKRIKEALKILGK
ncbi:MAG: Holliday junction DNA helicase RuvA [Candidatus Portnoybacteria bacterium RIFCSPLOWO2_12_FULL_39_9]|uniref:Holliday junction branch migration complex subunit RuvA n=1 Tax=Candidatus Portnoybacteria bacterium RIFCSPHIGHO2_12_FULL_38_9 TaxID=1801997 RepID=A0A1G2FEG2_9BACT|nr:MAG: Holliday junction DNA helicase RuvA [Candidatus Portnoybacteria bacterium RBG_13_40_8]OGZ36464.1 MAG: Holliday junction DNA helicase RuvA [Candidatus Portnoybacteria bacterium RIFCSPHIGHO2_12_FULL_38_9]OGZ39035.1 MAG: Holliday junction DNA helicase RuvA [Candidatus Portnoybacteria bacterium RIFCSPLOWO2_01_FULL_38_39]OGZ41240.1 MAG: Holliday junction DNA helicase RuvA [Candidatus Portnoybacteria bacterium RIFCSPLOWO2_12_FULL_39_9]